MRNVQGKKKKEKKPKRMSSGRNLKEHTAFYKWIKHYNAWNVELEERIEAIEKKLGINKKGE